MQIRRTLATLVALFIMAWGVLIPAQADYKVKDATGQLKIFASTGSGTSGSPYVPTTGLSGGSVTVSDGGGSVTVDNAGTFAVQNTPVPPTESLVYGTDNSTTSLALVSGVGGQTAKIYGIVVSSSADDTVTLKCGSTVKMGLLLAARGGLSERFPSGITCGVGEAVSLSKGSSATLHATLWYTQQ